MFQLNAGFMVSIYNSDRLNLTEGCSATQVRRICGMRQVGNKYLSVTLNKKDLWMISIVDGIL